MYLSLIICLFAVIPLWALNPPETNQRPVVDVLHGQTLTDPYRWLEADDDPDVIAWTAAQNEYTRKWLDSKPEQAAIKSRLKELMEYETVSIPSHHGSYLFYSKREVGQSQSRIWMQELVTGKESLFFDPLQDDPTGLTAIDWYSPNKAGDLIAVGISHAGDEKTVCLVLETATGHVIEKVEGKVSGLQWMPDGRSFFYHHLQFIDDPYSAQISYHKIGTSQGTLFFEQYKSGPFTKTWGPAIYLGHEGHYLALTYWTGTNSNDLWVVDVQKWLQTGKVDLQPVAVGNKNTYTPIGIIDKKLYFTTTEGNANGEVWVADFEKGMQIKTLISYQEKMPLENACLAPDCLLVSYLKDSCNEVSLYSYEGEYLRSLRLPGKGSTMVSAEPDDSHSYLYYTNFVTPFVIYQISTESGDLQKWRAADYGVDLSHFDVNFKQCLSSDGTPVSLFLISQKNLPFDGSTPVWLTGYGGFDYAMTPWFESVFIPWLENGGAIAIANIRGGGEYGAQWRRAGMLESKQNTFDDFISIAQWLIDEKITNPKKLVISGASNGGLLMGAALTQRPDLFAAVCCKVPLLDMIRYHKFLMGEYWVPEYGSSENETQFEYLMQYSPYHKVQTGTSYPAVLFMTALNDNRVPALHARKMAAKLQAANVSDSPVFLIVEAQAGHGQGKPFEARVQTGADQVLFLMNQVGFKMNDQQTLSSEAKEEGTVPYHHPIVVMETSKGTIKIEIYQKEVPATSAQFLDLVGMGFYNGLNFHRFEPGFVVQGGDPYGNGTGAYVDPATGKERRIPLEVKPNLKHDQAGVIAMARSSHPNSASCQFYFTLAPTPFLDGQYAVFGKIIEGLQVMEQLRRGDKMVKVSVQTP